MEYGFIKESSKSVEDLILDITAKLQTEGFGILTRTDVHEKFKEKLGIDYRKYIILGACSPKTAYQAIEAEENIGLLLPCNVIVYEKKNGKSGVGIVKPTGAMSVVENSALQPLALEVEAKLKRVFDLIE
jgi:uncharacterized protein (DUF302 family)